MIQPIWRPATVQSNLTEENVLDPMARKEHWLQTAVHKLRAGGFTLLNSPFKVAAHHSGFELTKFGNSETFFIFAEFDYLDLPLMHRFSTDAFNFAMKSKSSPLPCGLFESVWSFAVAIAHNIDDATAQRIKFEDPPSHWSAGEMRVAYDVARHQVYFFEKTPMWGGAYYNGFRNQIRKYLF